MAYWFGQIIGGAVAVGFLSYLVFRIGLRTMADRPKAFLLSVVLAYIIASILGGFGMANGGSWAGAEAAQGYLIPALLVGALGFFGLMRPGRKST